MTKGLSDQDFLSVIHATPLIAIDLIVRHYDGRVLLGLRENKPAQGFWFVPGGRVRKNERLSSAFSRLTQVELELPSEREHARFLGPYEHLYDDNYLGSSGVNTHYVVMAYQIQLEEEQVCSLDDQHSAQRWWTTTDLLNSDEVHANTKAYFDPAYAG